MRKLGQNLLIDSTIADREITYASVKKNDVVLEIGPGKGILTERIARKVKKVVAIEIDPFFVKKLMDTVPKNVTVIHADALKVDFTALPRFNKIISNLPFQISSPITFKFLEYPFVKAVCMYQKDFAERMIASPGTKQYCRLSVGIYYKTHCRILESVSKNCFSPIPKVDSSIVEMRLRKNPPFTIFDERFFFNVIRQLFSHRRKTIKNTLLETYSDIENIPFLDKRVEELSPEQIGELSNLLYNRYF